MRYKKVIPTPELTKNLSEFGISEKGAILYIALVQMGKQSATSLAKITDIPRTTVYEQIEKLLELGLVVKVVVGKKQLLVAEHPYKLESLLKDKQTLLHSQLLSLQEVRKKLPTVAESLLALIDSGAQSENIFVRLYEGKKAVAQIYRDTLDCNEMRTFFNADKFYEIFPKGGDQLWEALKNNPDRQVWDIAPTSSKTEEIKTGHKNYHLKAITDFPEEFAGFDLVIYNNKLALIQLEAQQVFGIVISSPLLYQAMKAIHKTMWNLL